MNRISTISDLAAARDNCPLTPAANSPETASPRGTNGGGAWPERNTLTVAAEIEPEANSGKAGQGLSDLPALGTFIEHQPPPSSFPARARQHGHTDAELEAAHEKKQICEEFLRLTKTGYSLNQAARAVGKSPSWFSGETSNLARYQRDGLAGLLPVRSATTTVGAITAQIEALTWFVPAAQFFYLITNRTNVSGSVPEAIRRVISLPAVPVGWTNTITQRFLKKLGLTILPTCPDEVREAILAREKSGAPLVPTRIHQAITRAVPQHVVEQYRRPHEAGLNYLQSPGTMMMVRRHGAEPQFARAGDILEADDGSINFPVCIPWSSPNGGLITETPCSANFGVIVGRFQWLRTIDAATRFRPGWVFVARSRGGFRGADVLTLMHGITKQHGAWEEYRFERGVFKSNLVKRAVELLGSRLHTVISPHSKPFIEGGFNQDWTKLSVHFPQCDIGRYGGDTEEATKIVQACRAGQKDPRKYFPMLSDALQAFAHITAEENRTLVKSRNSGQWVPEEKWTRETAANPLRQIEERMGFLFAPFAMEWTVRGMLVGGRVPILEDLSVPFDFSAPYLHEFSGAKVRLHFDPTAHKCFATPVLLQDWQGHRAGEILPQLTQINETTSYIRTVMGWGDDIGTAGLKAKQQAATAMRREVRTVMPGGRSGYSKSELKTLEATGVVEHGAKAAGSELESARTAQRTVPTTAERAAERAAKRAEIEQFEQANQHLFA